MANVCAIVLGLVSVQAVLLLTLQRFMSTDGSGSGSLAIGSHVGHAPGCAPGLQQRHDDVTKDDSMPSAGDVVGGAAAPSLAAFDPMPGVHIVYMYVNGSDPTASSQRQSLGGPAKGAAR